MTSIDMNDVFQTLFAVAWADGELKERERTFLADLVQRSEEASGVTHWFTNAPPQPDWDQLRDAPDTARAVLRQAVYMAAADETVQYEETMLLERLREQLGLSEQEFHQILREVEQDHA